ncbi:hypothetical protein SHINM1_005380 [Fluviibacter phosphoraccumulans]|nr:hypothetical protein SHINM1_005380 [Fluviibacter phosphoraccumulans]
MLEFYAMKKHVIASVKHACDAAGGQRPLAKFLGIRYCQVHQWVMGERTVPVRYCQSIVELTEGRVSLQDLRPKDWHLVWPPPKEITADPLHSIDYDPNEGNLS